MAAGIDNQLQQFRIDEYGRDEGSGCSYRVRVVTTEVEQEAEPININGRPGLHVHFQYHLFKELSWSDLQFSGQISRSHQEALSPLIDLGGIPLAARNDIILHIEPIQAHVQIYAYSYVSPNQEVDVFLGLDEEEDEFERMQEMSEADFLGRKPSSREALEKVSVSMIRETQCAVCLDGFPIGSQATRMPCSHAFHGPCILRWLEHRYLCPLCRFELPSAPPPSAI